MLHNGGMFKLYGALYGPAEKIVLKIIVWIALQFATLFLIDDRPYLSILSEVYHIHGVITGVFFSSVVGDCSFTCFERFLSIFITILIPAYHQRQQQQCTSNTAHNDQSSFEIWAKKKEKYRYFNRDVLFSNSLHVQQGDG